MIYLGKLKAHERTRRRPERIGALALFGTGVLEKIEGILGVRSPHEAVREALAESLCAYAGRSPYLGGSVGGHSGEGTSVQIQRQVEEDTKAAHYLQAVLMADNAAAGSIAVILETRGFDVMRLDEQLSTLIAELATIKPVDPDKTRRRDPEHWTLMWRVALFFEQVTHKAATLSDHGGRFGGAFFHVAKLVENVAAAAVKRPPLTNSALGNELRRLRKYRKRAAEL